MTFRETQETLTHDFILAFLAQFASSFIFFILIPTLPIYLAELGSAEIETGVLLGVFFFSSLMCRPFVGKALLKTRERKFMVVGSSLYGLASLAYLLAPPFWPFFAVRVFHGMGFGFFHMFILVGVIFGIGNAFLMPSLVAYVLDREGSSAGPAMGTFTAVSDLGLSLGPVIMGMVIHVSGYPAMFLCLACIGAINVLYFYFFVAAKRRPVDGHGR